MILYGRDDITSKQLIKHKLPEDIEDVFVEVTLRTTKRLIFGVYTLLHQSVE